MRIFNLFLTILISLALTSCSNRTYYQNYERNDYSKENWMRAIEVDPSQWTFNADAWYLYGQPNDTEKYARYAPINEAITISTVRVSNFTTIRIHGNFQVQIMGEQAHNSVYIIGPNAETRGVAVGIAGDTLYLDQATDCKSCLNKVIVRIGIRHLQTLIVGGGGNVTGRSINSNCLTILTNHGGKILMMGNMNLASVRQNGTGSITLIGVYTPNLQIHLMGGCLNIAGRMNVNSITNYGNSSLNLIGAESNALAINTGGMAKTAIFGSVNLKKISAHDASRVYIYWVKSDRVFINEYQNAQVGLAGRAGVIYLNLSDSSRYLGQYFPGSEVYVKTHGNSHANVAATRKVFASASDNSSIYFFGSPNIISKFSTENGTVIPMGTVNTQALPLPTPKQGAWNPNVYRFSTALKYK